MTTTAGGLPDPICRIWIGCLFPALEAARIIIIGSVFVHLAWFRYRCVIPDPLGLNEARTKPDPTRRRRKGSVPHPAFLFRVGWSSTDPNRIRFCTSGPVPLTMRYAGSAWPERSHIRLASGETDRDHIRHFHSGPDGH